MAERSNGLEEVVEAALRLSALDRVRLIERIVPTIESALTTRASTLGQAGQAPTAEEAARTAPGSGPFFALTPSIEALAAQQGVKPVSGLDDLRGDFWPEDESVDDFIATVRCWRCETA